MNQFIYLYYSSIKKAPEVLPRDAIKSLEFEADASHEWSGVFVIDVGGVAVDVEI